MGVVDMCDRPKLVVGCVILYCILRIPKMCWDKQIPSGFDELRDVVKAVDLFQDES